MARIPVYNDPVSAQAPLPGRSPERLYAEPDSFGSGAGTAALGRSLDETGNQLYDIAQRSEVSDVNAKLAQARSTWTNELAQRASKATPGDPTFADTFNADFQNAISQLGDNVNTVAGQQAVQRGSASLSADMSMAAGRFQIQSAGVKAKADYQTALQANSATLYHDPTQFGSVLQQTENDLANPNGPYAGMPADAREQLRLQTREALATSAFQGTVRLNPQLAQQQLQEGKWDQFVPSQNMWRLESLADTAIRGQEVASLRAQMQAEKAQKQAAQTTMDGFVKRLFSDDTSVKAPTMSEVLGSNLPPTGENSKVQFISMMDRENKPETDAKVSAANSRSLYQQITLADGDPRKITNSTQIDQAYINGDLTRTDHDWLRTQVEQAKTPEGDRLNKTQGDFLKKMEPQIDHSNPLLGKIDPSGPQQMYQYQFYVDGLVKQYRQAGKNPYDLFDPSKPDYVGDPKTLGMFQKTIKDSIDYVSQSLKRGTATQAPTLQPGQTTPLPPAKRPSLDEIFGGKKQ